MRTGALMLSVASIGAMTALASAVDVHRPAVTAAMLGGSECGKSSEPATSAPADAASAPIIAKLDPSAYFQKVVERYRSLITYRDTAHVVQVTQREGEEANRVETQIACEVADGKLKVKTPSSQARAAAGLNVPIKSSEHMRDAQLRYDLWLAPHMAMKFTDEPLKNMRAGVEEGFTPTQAEPVTIDNKRMVHLALRSGDGLS